MKKYQLIENRIQSSNYVDLYKYLKQSPNSGWDFLKTQFHLFILRKDFAFN
jgi:hypothetical protein